MALLNLAFFFFISLYIKLNVKTVDHRFNIGKRRRNTIESITLFVLMLLLLMLLLLLLLLPMPMRIQAFFYTNTSSNNGYIIHSKEDTNSMYISTNHSRKLRMTFIEHFLITVNIFPNFHRLSSKCDVNIYGC